MGRGFRSVAGRHAPVVQAHDLTVEAGEAAARLLSTSPRPPPDRPVAQADLLAAGAIRAAESLGLRVPEDLTVTGFDGVDLPWLDHVLTTVEQPGAEKGRRMGRLVRRTLEGRPSPTRPSRYGCGWGRRHRPHPLRHVLTEVLRRSAAVGAPLAGVHAEGGRAEPVVVERAEPSAPSARSAVAAVTAGRLGQ